MALTDLNHVNIRTANLDAIVGFYGDVLGLTSGTRPSFRFPGAWLYAGDRAVVHVVVGDAESTEGQPRIDHFAFSAVDLAGTLATLRAHDVAYRCFEVPGSAIRQVFFRDPDGNKIELDFQPHEMADMTAYPAP